MSLAGGLNAEGEDLAVPLPAEWTIDDLQGLTLHGFMVSPAVRRVVLTLRHFKVKYTLITKKAAGPYQKIPVAFVKGRQINDSVIILKNLLPILIGRALTDEEVAFDKHIMYKWQPSLGENVISSTSNLYRLRKLLGAPCIANCCITICGTCLVGYYQGKNNKEYPEKGDLNENASHGRSILGAKDYFGGDTMNHQDIAVYGFMMGWIPGKFPALENMLDKNDLRNWANRVGPQADALLKD